MKKLNNLSCEQLVEVIKLDYAIADLKQSGFPFTAATLTRVKAQKIEANLQANHLAAVLS